MTWGRRSSRRQEKKEQLECTSSISFEQRRVPAGRRKEVEWMNNSMGVARKEQQWGLEKRRQ